MLTRRFFSLILQLFHRGRAVPRAHAGHTGEGELSPNPMSPSPMSLMARHYLEW